MAAINNDHNKLVIAGTTALIAEPLLVGLMHGGGVGAILGLVAGGAAYVLTDDLAGKGKGEQTSLPAPSVAINTSKLADFGYRMVNGKSARDDPQTDVLPSDNLFDFSEEDDDEITLLSQRKGKSNIFRFSELLASGFVPTVNKIFVGRRLDNGEDIFVAAKDLCHIAFAGKTGGGKGSLMRLIMAQLCSVGCKVLLLNPHYMRWVVADNGPEFDEDWTPFEGINPRRGKPYLEVPPVDCADFPPIEQYLEWAVQTLLQDRKAAGREGGVRFKPYFIVLDEWPSIVDEIKNAPGQLAKLLREGRKYGIFVIVASQDFQVKTIGMDGGSVRKCLLTVFYTGGDKTTGKELLNMPEKDIQENEVGKGVVYLRCVGTQNQPVLVRVPFVDNDAVYKLLGPSTFKKVAARERVALSQPQQQQRQDTQNATLTLDDVIKLVRQHPEIDPLQFMNQLPDYRETDEDLPVVQQEPTRVVRSPYYEQSGPLRVDQAPTQVQPIREQVAQYPTYRKSTPTLPPDLQKALDAYEPGMSYRELGAKLGIGKDAAGKRIEELKRRKLI